MPADPLDGQQPRGRSLALMAADVRAAREVVREVRRGPAGHDRLLDAHQSLLTAMESYAAELTARGLPVPPKLHGDLRLQRGIARPRNAAG